MKKLVKVGDLVVHQHSFCNLSDTSERHGLVMKVESAVFRQTDYLCSVLWCKKGGGSQLEHRKIMASSLKKVNQ